MGTRKIFLPLVSDEEKKKALPVIQMLVQKVYERGLLAIRNGGTPPPPSFFEMFGDKASLKFNSANPEAFPFMGENGALALGEKVLLDLLRNAAHLPDSGMMKDSAFINDSMLMDVPCIVSVENPAVQMRDLGKDDKK